MSEEWLERQEGPDGQWCDLLTRIPYGVERRVEIGLSFARSQRDQMDAVLRALIAEDRDEKPRCSVKDALTGEVCDDINRAAAEVIQPWRVRAMELYNAWFKAAMPGPKGSSRTGNRTPTSGKAKRASTTGA